MRGTAAALFVCWFTGLGCGAAPAASTGGLEDGARLTSSLEIPAGQTVTIPRGARIVAGPGVTITVRGTLVVASPDAHVLVGAADASQPWTGLVIASGGRLDAEGLDLAGAETALEIASGSAGARYDRGTIVDATAPFRVDAGARLRTAHAKVVNAAGVSAVLGEFDASYLDYQSGGLAGGVIMMDRNAVFDVTDSTFHGKSSDGADFIVSFAAKLVRIAYSTITDAHCGVHFDDVTRFELDHVTIGASAPADPGGLVVYSAMLYGSGAGPHVISNSNLLGSQYGLDEQNPNGPITVTNTYQSARSADGADWTWLPAEVARAPIADARPR